MPPHTSVTSARNLWPTEKGSHPAFTPHILGVSPKHCGCDIAPHMPLQEMVALLTRDCKCLESEPQLATAAFEHPQAFRNLTLEHVRVAPERDYDGESFVCIWPTKFCPVGCDCCFFGSPPPDGDGRSEDTSISPRGMDRLMDMLQDANVGELVIAGGGEPFLEKNSMQRIAREAKARQIFLSTSAIWAKREQAAERVVSDIYENFLQNPHDPEVDFRISFDRFHAAKLSPSGDFQYALNLINIFRENYPNHPKFKVSFHSMVGDPAMEDFLAKLDVKERNWKNEKTEIITLEDGFAFEIRWKRLFYSDPEMDLRDMDAVSRNVGILEEDIRAEHNGNQSVTFNSDGRQGLDLLFHYDGSILNWGANAPDNEASIYTHTYDEMLQAAFDDVISLSMLEKGMVYREAIINEINPTAVTRAKALNLRDFYSRILLEEESTRLYFAIRVTQDYIAEGRIQPAQMETWPRELRELVALPKELLIKAYQASSHNIVTQYLRNPETSVADLLKLYDLVCKGHYNVSSGDMLKSVRSSDFADKEAFFEAVRELRATEFERAMSIGLSMRSSANSASALPGVSNAIWVDQETIRECGESMADRLPEPLRSRCKTAFAFLCSDNVADTPVGKPAVAGDGSEVYAHVMARNGKGYENTTAELHRDWIDMQFIVNGDPDIVGFNTPGSTRLSLAVDDPKAADDPRREGKHLIFPPDTWRKLSPGGILIVPPMTPHAPNGTSETNSFRRVVAKVKVD